MYAPSMFCCFGAALALIPATDAIHPPSHVHKNRATSSSSLCGENDLTKTSNFILYNNLWGKDKASSGSQCTYLDYDQDDTISWHSEWSWEGGKGDVKSYPNAVLNIDAKKLSDINGIPSTFNWTYSKEDIVADVSYDAFFSTSTSTTSGDHEYEVMVWLATLGGAAPIGNSDGPIASPEIGGITWDLYKGDNSWKVYSFVAKDTVHDYSGDINDFFQYLINNEGVSSDLYLQTIGAGTEPFTGANATFTVSPYSISLN